MLNTIHSNKIKIDFSVSQTYGAIGHTIDVQFFHLLHCGILVSRGRWLTKKKVEKNVLYDAIISNLCNILLRCPERVSTHSLCVASKLNAFYFFHSLIARNTHHICVTETPTWFLSIFFGNQNGLKFPTFEIIFRHNFFFSDKIYFVVRCTDKRNCNNIVAITDSHLIFVGFFSLLSFTKLNRAIIFCARRESSHRICDIRQKHNEKNNNSIYIASGRTQNREENFKLIMKTKKQSTISTTWHNVTAKTNNRRKRWKNWNQESSKFQR